MNKKLVGWWLIVIALGLMTTISHVAMAHAQSGTTSPAGLPTNRTGFMMEAIGTKIYVAGGRNGSLEVSALEIYDTVTGQWQTGANMPYAVSYAASGVDNGKLYLYGGWCNCPNGTANPLQIYDPISNSWSFVTQNGTQSSEIVGAAGATVNGKFYVTGGYQGYAGPWSRLFIYDFNQMTWSNGPDIPNYGDSADASSNYGGKIYVVGGFWDFNTTSATAYIFDPAGNSWTELAPMPTSRGSLAAVVSSGKLYAMGGDILGSPRPGTFSSPLSTVEIYNFTTNVWTTGKSLPAPCGDCRAVLVNGMIYYAGGDNPVLQLYDPNGGNPTPTATPTFTPTPTSTPVPPTATSTPPPIDAAELVAQGDYTTVGPNESVQFWINVRNSGNTTWRASTGYGWRGMDEWSARTEPIWRDVPPGDVLSFSQAIIAPSQPGEYTYGFILQHSGQGFGPHFFIKITVQFFPVVLVHGWNDTADSWDDYRNLKLNKFLPSIGLTGYAVDNMHTGAGGGAIWSIDQNAQNLATYIAWVKSKTGAKKVDIVAHSMGGLIARRYIGKYMNANAPDVHQLIMLGTPNLGSLTAVANQLTYYLGVSGNPSTAELTPVSVGLFNLNPENSNHHGVPFYVIAGNYGCLTKFPPLNPLEREWGLNDIAVAAISAFVIPLDGSWIFPGVLPDCKGDHRGMRDDASNDGGLDIFNQYVKPLLQGETPGQSNVQASKIGQKDNTLQVLDTMSQVQFTGVQAGTLRPGTQLTFSHSSESTSHASFLVVGPPDQMSVSLRDPNGQLILPNTSNPAIQYTQMDKNILPFTSYTISNPVPGMWTTIVEANAQTPAVGVGVAALGSLISDLRLTLPLAGSTPVILQPISITAQLQSGNTPLVGATVNAQLIFPNQTVQQISLLDDGLHGDGNAGDGLYGYQFTPLAPGVYSASIRAEGANGNTTFQRSAVWATQVDGNQIFLPVILHR